MKLTHELNVELIDWMGTDDSVINAARVSTQKSAEGLSEKGKANFINRLIKDRHGSPCESGVMKFRLSFPIAMSREQVRHRMSSINEESARYSVLEREYYLPPEGRKLTQVGKTMDYVFEDGTPEQAELLVKNFIDAYTACDIAYENMLEAGIAKEIARFVNPVGMYTHMIVTMNLRSLMNYLSLRVESEKSHPQWEIQQIAHQMEDFFTEKFPLTHEAFVNNGRVAP